MMRAGWARTNRANPVNDHNAGSDPKCGKENLDPKFCLTEAILGPSSFLN